MVSAEPEKSQPRIHKGLREGITEIEQPLLTRGQGKKKKPCRGNALKTINYKTGWRNREKGTTTWAPPSCHAPAFIWEFSCPELLITSLLYGGFPFNMVKFYMMLHTLNAPPCGLAFYKLPHLLWEDSSSQCKRLSNLTWK